MKFYSLEILEPLFLALEETIGVQQKLEYHPEKDVFAHSLQVLEWAFRETNDTELILAAMLHDVGKARNSIGHEEIAIEMIGEYVSAKTRWLIEQHMRFWAFINGEMRKLSKVKNLAENPLLPELVMLARWDKLGRNPNCIVVYDKEDIVKRLNMCAERHFIDNIL